ncbi:MAG TPA: TOBE domain-containing protein, partial [bacterium]|nr:TOBE domain-containing protein [bacterium]
AGRRLGREPTGPHQLLTVHAVGKSLKVTIPPEFHVQPGAQVWLRLNPARIRLFDPQTGEALRRLHDE